MAKPRRTRAIPDFVFSVKCYWRRCRGAGSLLPGRIDLVTAATATAAATPAGEPSGRIGGASAGCGEYGKLNGSFFAGALGAADFLLLVDHDFFETLIAGIADVFVNRHREDSPGMRRTAARMFIIAQNQGIGGKWRVASEEYTIIRKCVPP